MRDALVELDNVSRQFGSGTQAVVAVSGVSLTAGEHARIAVVGPSGSGKSTLLHLIAGLDDPTSGVIRWPGLSASPKDNPAEVGVVFQASSLIPTLTAVENVSLPLMLRGMNSTDANEEAMSCLHALSLESVRNQLPDELSGGQEQRVAVARVMAMAPQLILADEPTGKLDQHSGELVVDVLQETAERLGAALIVATHDPRIAKRMDITWRLVDGAVETNHSAEGVTVT
jgi:putative ABC transport system ATP-binding protein